MLNNILECVIIIIRTICVLLFNTLKKSIFKVQKKCKCKKVYFKK